jgi:tetratricopeptide (TPR) repeat protein
MQQRRAKEMTTTKESIDWDADVAVDDEEVYESLMRSIARTERFGLFFVRCVEKDRANLEQRLKVDLPELRFERLELEEEMKDGNLYRRVAEVSQQLGPLNGLFISGLEKSLDPHVMDRHVKPRYGGEIGAYYNTVPRLLGHLNLQRERFRDDFPFCLIFFLSAFGIKFIARRSPDFFDWRSGLYEFSAVISKLTPELIGDYDKYLTWTSTRQLDRIREIQALIDEDRQTSSGNANLFFETANILAAVQSYEEAIKSYDKAIEFKPDLHQAWHNRGIALTNLNQREDILGRHEEAIKSYDKAIEFKPDYHQAWHNRGIALGILDRYEAEIASYDKAIEFKPDYHQVWSKRGIALGNLNRYEAEIASYDKAIEIKPDYHEAWYNRGIALTNLNRYEEAIASYDKAIEIKPDYSLALQARTLAALQKARSTLPLQI